MQNYKIFLYRVRFFLIFFDFFEKPSKIKKETFWETSLQFFVHPQGFEPWTH